MKQIFTFLFTLQLLLWGTTLSQAQTVDYVSTGKASYYASHFDGKTTAFGEVFNNNAFTCAHHSLPLGTILKVTRLDKNVWVKVRVNDRCKNRPGYAIDLSQAAARRLGMINEGVAPVRVRAIGHSNKNPTWSENKPMPTFADISKGKSNAHKWKKTQTVTTSTKVDKQPRKVTPKKTTPKPTPKVATKQQPQPKAKPKPTPKPAAKPKEYTYTAPQRKPITTSTPQSAPKPQVKAEKQFGPPLPNATRVNKYVAQTPSYAIQLYAYYSKKQAEAQIVKLQKRGLKSVFLYDTKSPKGKRMYKVIVAPFDNARSVRSYINTLKKDFNMEGSAIQIYP